LRGVKRRSNPAFLAGAKMDCFASARNDGTCYMRPYFKPQSLLRHARPCAGHPRPFANRREERGWPGRRAKRASRFPAMTANALVIARSETTKQSIFLGWAKVDCFASARNDGTCYVRPVFHAAIPPASCPALCRASTSFGDGREERGWPGRARP